MDVTIMKGKGEHIVLLTKRIQLDMWSNVNDMQSVICHIIATNFKYVFDKT